MGTSTPDPSAAEPVPEERSYLLLERLRWDGHPATCPHCGAAGRCYLLRPAGGLRRTRTGAPTGRRIWKCGTCRRQFSVLTGTVLQGTRIPLSAWIRAVDLFVRAERPVNAADVSRATGLGREAGRHVVARWDAACDAEPLRALVIGTGQLFQG